MQSRYIQLRSDIISVLKTIFDPEIPVNIWDLGLIYGVDVNNKGEVTIIMTLTSPNCPAIDILPRQIEEQVENLDGVNAVTIKLVWDPPWNESLMTEEARLELGML